MPFHTLAWDAGISRTTLWEIESGLRKNPTAPVMSRLARALGVSTAELATRPEPVPVPVPVPAIQTETELQALMAKFWARLGANPEAAKGGSQDDDR